MLKIKPNNQFSGVYRTRDSIDNFQIRVSLRRLYSIIKIPKFEAFQSTTPSTDQQATTDFEQTVTVKWQQKVFSKTERVYYAQKENCKSELEKRYHQMIKETDECGLIFTYIHDDSYQPLDHFGSQEIQVTKLRKNIETVAIPGSDKSAELYVDKDQTSAASRYLTGGKFVAMFVMADLDPITLLMTIHYRKSDGLLIIFPDFNDVHNEYHLEIDQNSKQSFVYVVENLSTTFNDTKSRLLEKEKLENIQKETHKLMKKLDMSKELDFTYPKFCRTIVILEIIDGSGFEFDNIHVQFHIKVPKFVRLVDGILSGSTHSSLANGNSWNFGFCHSIVLEVDDEFLLSKSLLDSIVIDFEAISIDKLWQRERREGIATLKVPLEGKSQTYEVSCFRDLQGGSWINDFLERFFVGGVRKTEDFEHKNSSSVNFYGNQTVSTGTLKVKIKKIHQMKPSKRNNLKLKSIDEIISSYHKAKLKLEI